MNSYNHKEIEPKWQRQWEEWKLYEARDDAPGEKKYVLDMFPYPSGAGLHVGHPEGYTATDIYSRYLRMNGYNVLHPMGWDAFGLPAENYAIKSGVHPAESTANNIETFRRQIKSIGLSYDWSREVNTSSPDYYKWTQWFFLFLYERGLAYKKKANVNWCPSCQTVLANEQVVNGACERCGTAVLQKELAQWFFKVTEYAESLLNDLDTIDWPNHIKEVQRNWIGKSEGAELEFRIKNEELRIQVFTTRPDTLFGATYMVLAPEHALVQELRDVITNWSDVEAYISKAATKSELQRTDLNKEKTGVELQGIKAINPATNEEIPVWIADYVLANYGTGAIMAVPAHDERDFEFAKRFDLPIKPVVMPKEQEIYHTQNFNPNQNKEFIIHSISESLKMAVTIGPGLLINSGEFDGMDSEQAKYAITEHVGGKMKTQYRLRDWLVSRQRYWGAPIPIVYDPEGNPHPVKLEHLPLELPTDVDYQPKGTSPLGSSEAWKKKAEELYGPGWHFEVDTMDTFVCSSWYYFRYTDSKNDKEFANKEKIKTWLPVDLYVGGAEHAVLHLMYARFFTKALQSAGHVDFSEPFQKLRNQGMILAEDGRKMSKSLGNVINPDQVIEDLGADSLRLYEMFMGPLEDTKPWQTRGIVGVRRFLERVWGLQDRIVETLHATSLQTALHKTIKKVTNDIETLNFNTAISAMMIFVNEAQKTGISKEQFALFLQILSPFAPHVAEELWQQQGHTESIFKQPWPKHDEALTQDEMITIAVQVNGKMRDTFEIARDMDETAVRETALARETVKKWTDGKEIAKVIYVPGKILNIVVR